MHRAVRLNPKSALAFCCRGIAYQDKADLDKALADYNEAIRLNPKWGRAYYHRGTAYEKKGEKAKAEADFARSRELEQKP